MTKTTHFFLGANSGRGFQNLFGEFCTPEDHHDLLVLKGGPGAGKSTMMRRIGQAMEQRGEQADFDAILRDIQERDWQDEHRAIAPLKQAADAALLDTTQLNLEQSCDRLLSLVKEKIAL